MSLQQIDFTKYSAKDIIEHLALKPHPEGGHYRETWQADGPGRATGTCIFFLLAAGERSHWHRVDATEIWHYYVGAPMRLLVSETDAGPAQAHMLGPDIFDGQTPQVIVPPHHWQSAQSTDQWTLVGCTVSPGFTFEGFELAQAEFDIPRQG